MACRLFGAMPLSEPAQAYYQLDSWELISVKFGSNVYHLRSWKSIWNGRLPKLRPFCLEGGGGGESFPLLPLLPQSISKQWVTLVVLNLFHNKNTFVFHIVSRHLQDAVSWSPAYLNTRTDYLIHFIKSMLITWLCKQPWHQQPCCCPSYPEICWFEYQRNLSQQWLHCDQYPRNEFELLCCYIAE